MNSDGTVNFERQTAMAHQKSEHAKKIDDPTVRERERKILQSLRCGGSALMDASRKWLLIIVPLPLALAACDGVYSSTQATDGSVVVVNKYTGTVQKVQGTSLIEVRPPAVVAEAKRTTPVLTPESIPQQPVEIRGASEFRDGNMLVRLTILPNKTPPNEAAWADWRAYILRAHVVAGLSLQFWDAAGFDVLEHSVELSEMRRIVDLKGEFGSYETQLSIPTSESTYYSIVGWSVGWHGWPVYVGPLTGEAAPSK